jgi:DNA-binding CsgD family transcriptional regulator
MPANAARNHRADPLDALGRTLRLLRTLERLLALQAVDLESAMQRAAQLVHEALGADKVDVFLPAASQDGLIAAGTSDTPMGRRQHALGLNHLRVADGPPPIGVWRTGQPYLTGHADQDPTELRGVIDDLGVRSTACVPVIVAGVRQGVLMACSAVEEFFTPADLDFLLAVAHWVGLVGERATQVQQLARDAAQAGYQTAAEEAVKALTPRQREVAALLARGLSNAEIAQRLVLDQGTVANHVAHILDRLGFRSRTQVAVWATERGLHAAFDQN